MHTLLKRTVTLILFSCICIAATRTSLLHKPKIIGSKLPKFSGVTISGIKVDSSYFANKVTLITFFHVGCQPCVNEINALKKLKRQKYFQVLYIVSHTAWEIKQFNADHPNSYSKKRQLNKAGKIEFDILPQCEESKEKGKPLMESDCYTISLKFGARSFPSTYLVDKKGIIRQAWYGFSMDSVNTNLNINAWQKEIDKLLAK